MLVEDVEFSQRHLVQRLDRLESSVAFIEDAVLKAQEEGSTRHEEMVSRLEQLKDDISDNYKILKKLRDRGCLSCCHTREFIFIVILIVLAAWLYAFRNFTSTS